MHLLVTVSETRWVGRGLTHLCNHGVKPEAWPSMAFPTLYPPFTFLQVLSLKRSECLQQLILQTLM